MWGKPKAWRGNIMTTPTPTPTSPQELYQLIKDQELDLPSLDPRATVVIGTLDGATGVFDWAIPLSEDPPQTPASLSPDIAPPNGPPPPFRPGYYRYTCPASVLVTLRFQIINRSGEFVVSGFGQVVTAPAGQDYADLVLQTILAPGQNNVSCFIQYGTGSVGSFQAPFVILQLPVAAVGAFTIPALPVSVVYAPPQAAAGSASKFSSSYTETSSLTRAITTSVSSTNSTKAATNYTPSTFITTANSAITSLFSIGSAIGQATGDSIAAAAPYVKGATAGLSLIAQNINNTTVSENTGITVTSSSKVTVSLVEETVVSTFPGPALGPGEGDVFYYLYNVLVAWLAVNGELGLLVLASGSQTPAQFTAQDLRVGDSDLAPAVVNGLLALDPFNAKVPYPLLGNQLYYYMPANRFALYESLKLGPATGGQKVLIYTLTQENLQTSIQTQTTITDFKPGFLESVFGDNQTTESTLTTSYSVTDDTTVGDSTEAQFIYTVAPTDPTYDVDVWYDLLFGTYAFVVPGQETQAPAFALGPPPVRTHPVQ